MQTFYKLVFIFEGEEFLTPTKIYVKTVLEALKVGKVKAFAHITGGGLTENIPRVLNDKVAVELNAEAWKIPPLFAWLAVQGKIDCDLFAFNEK